MTRGWTRCYHPGLAGLLTLLVGCGTAATPSAPASPDAGPATPVPVPAPPTPAPDIPSPPALAAPAPVVPAPSAPMPSMLPSPVTVPSLAPPPTTTPPAGGGGGGAPPAAFVVPPTPKGLPIAEVTVDSEMGKAPKGALADANPASRWTSRSLKGAWAQVALSDAHPLHAMTIQMAPGLPYNVQTSTDGRTWRGRLWSAVNKSWLPEVKVFGAGVTARYVRVTLKGATKADRPFSILELQLHEPGPTEALPPAPPWPRPLTPQTVENIAKAGVGYMAGDHANVAQHIHVYVSIWYNGKRIEIPANLGIADGNHATMHTHDATGTVHMEGPAGQTFTLGQFFTIWGVPLTGAKVYLRGRRVADPATLQLADKQLIKVIYGPAPAGAGVPFE